jgi:hypothetical protein
MKTNLLVRLWAARRRKRITCSSKYTSGGKRMNEEVITGSDGKPKFGMSIDTLKYIAIIAMAIDHMAHAFVPNGSVPAVIMHFIGATTGPVMFYAAVEGYHHTRNINKYMARLAVFAAISWLPFVYFRSGVLADTSYIRPNVIYTILLGVAAIRIRRELKNPIVKTILILCLIILCIPADWGTLGIIIIIVFDYFYGNFKNQAFGYCLIVSLHVGVLSLLTYPFYGLIYERSFSIDAEYYMQYLVNIGMFIPIILLNFYNGQKGKSGTFSKWVFYVFYPLHLLLLGFLQTLL